LPTADYKKTDNNCGTVYEGLSQKKITEQIQTRNTGAEENLNFQGI
jgi:hypothetical protein